LGKTLTPDFQLNFLKTLSLELSDTCAEKQKTGATRRSLCGQVTAYPQDEMCRSVFFVNNSFFIHLPSFVDTMIVQLVANRVNR
jgi:hypothetical protein